MFSDIKPNTPVTLRVDPVSVNQSKHVGTDGKLRYDADGSEVFPGATGVRKPRVGTTYQYVLHNNNVIVKWEDGTTSEHDGNDLVAVDLAQVLADRITAQVGPRPDGLPGL